ncbi:unnamed protein product [Allacma fusca]|uniref:Uncharacterized protein n=1 Tax=Allacma fusca TaxID=39272 RepID=A0A8J2LNI7_9HEXA|nr:unnamed protein product [Allacma fusca]
MCVHLVQLVFCVKHGYKAMISPEDTADHTSRNPGPEHVESITISTSSGQIHDWFDYKKVTLVRCFNSILPETILRSSDTLTELTFSEYTLFKNIKRCLKNLNSLRTLHFTDVIIDAYHRFLYTKIIDVPSLTNLTIRRSTKLTNSEYFLLDFLTRGVNCKTLAKFQLVEGSGLEEGSNLLALEESAENQEPFEDVYDHDVVIVARFLMKHHTSLRNVSVSGTHVKVWDSEKTKEHFVQNLKLLKLDSFTYSTTDAGLKLILCHQKQLKHLHCSTDIGDVERVQNIYDCVKECRRTLTSFHIICKIRERIENEQGYSFECKHFEHCHNLSSFELTSKALDKDGATNELLNNNVSSFEVLNVHLLPISLRLLTLTSESFPNDSIEKLFEQLPKFEDLETFKLETNSPYSFKLSWLQTLCNLPKIQSVTINGAFVDVKQEVDELIKDSRQGINILFNNNDISCFPSGKR